MPIIPTFDLPTPQQGYALRQMYQTYQKELGPYGKREQKYFDLYRTKQNHAIYTMMVNGKLAGFTFLRWGEFDGTEITEYYVHPNFRRDDIAFQGFKTLSEKFPGRWQGRARKAGGIAAFWKHSIKRVKGNIEKFDKYQKEYLIAYHTTHQV